MSNFFANSGQKQKFLRAQISADIKESIAISNGQIPIPAISVPMEVTLPFSAKKARSFVKEQAFPDELLSRAVAAFKRHGKKVLVVIVDTNFKPHHSSARNVVREDLGKNFTTESENSNTHYATCLGNLVADHPQYAGVMQELHSAGAVEFALHKCMRGFGGVIREIESAMRAQVPIDGYSMTIYSNSWGGSGATEMQAKIINDQRKRGGPVAHFYAAGNDGSRQDTDKDDKVGYPAKFSYPMAIGALSEDNSRAYFSSPGPTIDFAVGGHQTLSVTNEGKVAVWSGTSSSCPYMAGLGAILFLLDPDTYNTHAAIRAGLSAASVDITKLPAVVGRDNFTGSGLPQLMQVAPPIEDAPEDPDAGNLVDMPREVEITLHDVLIECEPAEAKKLLKGKPAKIKHLIGKGTIG